jgi:hypothetical protein
MIEVPRGALTADEIARDAAFFSFQAFKPLNRGAQFKTLCRRSFLVSQWGRGHHECAQPSDQLSQPKRKPISLNAPAIDTSPVRRYSSRQKTIPIELSQTRMARPTPSQRDAQANLTLILRKRRQCHG